MKQTPQTSQNQRGLRRDNRARRGHRSFPLTDYSFQTTADAESSSSAVLPARKAPAFHKLSSEFFGTEMSRDYVTQFLLFTLIGGISAWPIISMLVAVTRLIRNY
jgi:hypothetical protein